GRYRGARGRPRNGCNYAPRPAPEIPAEFSSAACYACGWFEKALSPRCRWPPARGLVLSLPLTYSCPRLLLLIGKQPFSNGITPIIRFATNEGHGRTFPLCVPAL